MLKIYCNVRPRHLNEEIDMGMLRTSLENGDIKVPEGYACDCEYDCHIFQQAVNLRYFLDCHGVDLPVGVTCDPNEMYCGWILIIDAVGCHVDSLDAVVSRFFTWSTVENQSIMDFEELIKDEWN